MNYTRSQFESRVNAGIQGKIGMLISSEETLNEAVRNIINNKDIDIRTSRRRAALVPNLFNGIYDYTAPTDLKSYGIIDINAQAADKRQDGDWQLVPSELFERDKEKLSTVIAVDDYNGVRILKINSKVDSKEHVFSSLDSLTAGGGTWTTVGDAESLAKDDSDYIKGNGSLKFDIGSGGATTAGIVNSELNSFDMTDYFGGTSALFAWHRITDTTDITNYIIRFGSSSGNYFEKTVTATANGTAFVDGWNLLKFDVESLSETGTVDKSAITYISLFMTKASGKISESDYKFDHIVLKKGVINNLKYYSKYGWKSDAGVYKENSDAADDILLADTDEFNLYVAEGRVLAAEEVDLPIQKVRELERKRNEAIEDYNMKNPSESKNMSYDYFKFEDIS